MKFEYRIVPTKIIARDDCRQMGVTYRVQDTYGNERDVDQWEAKSGLLGIGEEISLAVFFFYMTENVVDTESTS